MTVAAAVTPPDQSVWWDPAAVTAAALKQLRLTEGDVDQARVAGYVPVAGYLANEWQDRDSVANPVPDPVPPPWTDALVQVVVELYRRKDAPPVSLDGALLGAWRPPSTDPLAGVYAMFRGAKRRWGLS